MNESVVERSLDVAHTEDVLSVLAWLSRGGTVVGNLLLLHNVSLLLVLGLNTTNGKSAVSINNLVMAHAELLSRTKQLRRGAVKSPRLITQAQIIAIEGTKRLKSFRDSKVSQKDGHLPFYC